MFYGTGQREHAHAQGDLTMFYRERSFRGMFHVLLKPETWPVKPKSQITTRKAQPAPHVIVTVTHTQTMFANTVSVKHCPFSHLRHYHSLVLSLIQELCTSIHQHRASILKGILYFSVLYCSVSILHMWVFGVDGTKRRRRPTSITGSSEEEQLELCEATVFKHSKL